MIDVNRIRRAPWQLVEFATDAIRTATGLRRFRNAEAVAIITPGKILQLQSAGTRDVLQSLTSGGQTRAAGPYVISHSRATAGSRGWGQAYGEAWVELIQHLNPANVATASGIFTCAGTGVGDIQTSPNAVMVAFLIDGSMYVGTNPANSLVRCMILPLPTGRQA